MAIEFNAEKYSGRTPEIWRGECKMLPGGFIPSQAFAPDFVLHRGTPVYVDFDTHKADVCKSARVLDGSVAKEIRVTKGTAFQVGDEVVKYGVVGTEESPAPVATISKIVRTNVEYDVLTLSASVATAKDDVIILKDCKTPNAVVGADLKFTGKGLPTMDVAYEAVVLYPSLAEVIVADWLNGFCLKSNPNILFIKQ